MIDCIAISTLTKTASRISRTYSLAGKNKAEATLLLRLYPVVVARSQWLDWRETAKKAHFSVRSRGLGPRRQLRKFHSGRGIQITNSPDSTALPGGALTPLPGWRYRSTAGTLSPLGLHHAIIRAARPHRAMQLHAADRSGKDSIPRSPIGAAIEYPTSNPTPTHSQSHQRQPQTAGGP